MSKYEEAVKLMERRFGHDNLISVATVKDGRPSVRTVDAYYEDEAFYSVTYSLSNKMLHIKDDPNVAVCGEWFSGHGTGENLGYVRNEENAEIMSKLRTVFAEWYDNGHIDENDPNTCVLRVTLTDGVLLNEGTKYDIDFAQKTAS